MASLSVIKRASALLLSSNRSVLLKRSASNDAPMIVASLNDKTKITTISMSRPAVNSISLEFATELRKALENCSENGSKGVVLTSALPKVFSAGLDINEMYKPDMKRCKDFWNSVQDMWLTLYGLGIPTAAAINGASPAGGCLLALACEYRVMVEGEHSIGLNETRLGIIAPKWFQDSLVSTVGYRQAELALLRGTLFKPQEALKIGMIDEIVPDKNEAIARCEKYIAEYAKISPEAREATKMSLRKDNLGWLEANREWDTQVFLSFVQTPKVQKGLELYMQALKNKSK